MSLEDPKFCSFCELVKELSCQEDAFSEMDRAVISRHLLKDHALKVYSVSA